MKLAGEEDEREGEKGEERGGGPEENDEERVERWNTVTIH